MSHISLRCREGRGGGYRREGERERVCLRRRRRGLVEGEGERVHYGLSLIKKRSVMRLWDTE